MNTTLNPAAIRARHHHNRKAHKPMPVVLGTYGNAYMQDFDRSPAFIAGYVLAITQTMHHCNWAAESDIKRTLAGITYKQVQEALEPYRELLPEADRDAFKTIWFRIVTPELINEPA